MYHFAAYAKPCYDPSHGHSIGGGDYWRVGYQHLLSKAAAAGVPLITEENGEVYMDMVSGYLSVLVSGKVPKEKNISFRPSR